MRRHAGTVLLFGGILALASSGCILNDDCDAKPIPIAGTPSDYTLQAGRVGDVTLHAPMACPQSAGFNQDGDARLIALEGHGASTFGLYGDAGCTGDGGIGCGSVSWYAFVQDASDTVRASHPDVQWLVAASVGTECEPDPPLSGCRYNLRAFNIHTNDWRVTDALVAALRQGMEQQNLGECVGVLVRQIEVACPH